MFKQNRSHTKNIYGDNDQAISSPQSKLNKTLLQNSKTIISSIDNNILKREDISLNDYITASEKIIVPLTLMIPAYNEESLIGSALTSVLKQSVMPERIIVIDDSSTDRTSEIAKTFEEVTVIKTPKNTGAKGDALNYGLSFVNSPLTLTMDADITCEEKAIEKMIKYIETRPEVSAACCFVLPKDKKTIWERFRFVEYLFALSFYKNVQEMYGSVVVCSGCFAIYKTNDLKSVGGWPTTTVAEDLELTWIFYEQGMHIGYSKDTLTFSEEPQNYHVLFKQLKRWNIGYFQVLKLKWKDMKNVHVIREFVIAGLLDTFIGVIFNSVLIYYTIFHYDPSKYLYFIALDMTLLLIPSIWFASKIKRIKQLLRSLPVYLIFRFIGSFWFFYGLVSVLILKKTTKGFEKGH